MITSTRCPCGQPADGWPGDGDDELCQECWEAYCDTTWWDRHQDVARWLHPETFPNPDPRVEITLIAEDEGRPSGPA